MTKIKFFGVLVILSSLLGAVRVPRAADNCGRDLAVTVESVRDDGLVLGITVGAVDVEKCDPGFLTNAGDESFVQVKLGECAFTSEIGKPKLPLVAAVLDVPYRAAIDVETVDGQTVEYSLAELGITERIVPARASVPKIPGATAHFVLDKEVYAADRYYPERLTAIFEDGGLARGHRLVTVQYFPVQYNPAQKKIRVYTALRLKISFRGGDIPATRSAVARDYSPVWEQFIRRMVVNYPAYLAGVVPLPVYYDIFYRGSAQNFSSKLAAWKQRKGFKVRMWDAAGWTAGRINDTIRMQNPQATYLVIVGDPNSTAINLPASGTGQETYDQTDLYYAETNESGYLPDMFFGRLSVLDTIQGNTVVDKAVRFEHAEFGSAGTSWLKKACLIAGYDSYWQNVGIATNAYCRDRLLPLGYQVDTLVIASNEQEGRIVSQINAGRAWMVYTAHGTQTSWAISSSGSFTLSELTTLTNNLDMYCLPAGHCCLTGDYEFGSNTFGETWDRLSGKAGLGYYGSVSYSYWDEDDWLQRRYFDVIYTDSVPGRIYETGRFTQWGLYWIQNHTGSALKRYYFETYVNFNDPSLDFWTEIPSAMTVAHAAVIPAGTNVNFDVNVTANSLPVENALVGCWIKAQTPPQHAAAYTDGAGNATLVVSPANDGDTMYVTVTKHDRLPYEGFALVAATAVEENRPGVRRLSLTASPSISGRRVGLRYGLPAAGAAELKIFDAGGRVVRNLPLDAGLTQGFIDWDGTDEAGKTAARGVYFAKLKASGRELIRKIILAR